MGKPYGAAADAWSIGVLAYEILTLSEPFRSPNLAALMKRVIACEYDAQSLADAPHDDEVKAVATDKVTHVARRPMHTPRSMAAALTSRGPPHTNDAQSMMRDKPMNVAGSPSAAQGLLHIDPLQRLPLDKLLKMPAFQCENGGSFTKE